MRRDPGYRVKLVYVYAASTGTPAELDNQPPTTYSAKALLAKAANKNSNEVKAYRLGSGKPPETGSPAGYRYRALNRFAR